jgi:hypothetical protein
VNQRARRVHARIAAVAFASTGFVRQTEHERSTAASSDESSALTTMSPSPSSRVARVRAILRCTTAVTQPAPLGARRAFETRKFRRNNLDQQKQPAESFAAAVTASPIAQRSRGSAGPMVAVDRPINNFVALKKERPPLTMAAAAWPTSRPAF